MEMDRQASPFRHRNACACIDSALAYSHCSEKPCSWPTTYSRCSMGQTSRICDATKNCPKAATNTARMLLLLVPEVHMSFTAHNLILCIHEKT